MKKLLTMILLAVSIVSYAQTFSITTRREASNREKFAAEYLSRKLSALGYSFVKGKADYRISLIISKDSTVLKQEGFRLSQRKRTITIEGGDATGVIYGCNELVEQVKKNHMLMVSPTMQHPEMVMRGTCIGLQKTVYLPGHGVYEYPYTPENFPWFYDKAEWVKYLDMMVENRMNSLYLWNGHPFASLVKLKDYPFALEVDEATFRKNEEIFSFLTHEADRRGIFVIQMFYNIILSKPFADHYGLKTQDRHRPITPLISDYTRKSVAAFIEKYPNVGLLVYL